MLRDIIVAKVNSFGLGDCNSLGNGVFQKLAGIRSLIIGPAALRNMLLTPLNAESSANFAHISLPISAE